MSFILWIIFFIDKNTFFDFDIANWQSQLFISTFSISTFLLFIFGSIFILKNYKFRLFSIRLKNLEIAAEKSIDNQLETILDKEIKELVYILKYAKIEIVVFEDLDRFNNLTIFTKLRELNFCLNAAKSNLSFLKSKIRKIICKEEKVVRFFYLITDSLFAEAEQRTKFFDFIIPVVPVLNSYNSRQKLENFFKSIDEEKKPGKELLSHICFYINDMRLLKNIINEYQTYTKVIDIESKNLKIDNLFSIILIKNFFPREYEQLLKNEGIIFDVISKIKNSNELLSEKYKEKIIDLENQINNFKLEIDNSEFDFLASKIPKEWFSDADGNLSQYLKTWFNKNPNERKYSRIKGNITFNRLKDILWSGNFITQNDYDNFVLKNKQRKRSIEEKTNFLKEINKKNDNLTNFNFEQKKNELREFKEIEKIFQEAKCETEKYGLVRYLVLNDFLDQNYFYYIGFIYQGSLSANDQNFLKLLREEKEIGLFFEINNPNNIYEELVEDDYSRTNILNFHLLNALIEKKEINKIIKLFSTIEKNEKIDEICEIFNKLKYEHLSWIVGISFFRFENLLIKMIEHQKESETTSQVLLSIYTQNLLNDSDYKKLVPYKEFVENSYFGTISFLSESEKEIFIKNLMKANVKLSNLEILVIDKSFLQKIENNKLFKLTSSNLKYLLINLENKIISYSTMISDLYNSKIMLSSKNYLEEEFDNFIENDYIHTVNNSINNFFKNNEKETIRILNSGIYETTKINYVQNNKTIINDISEIKNLAVLKQLFQLNQVYLNHTNVKNYWEKIFSESSIYTHFDYFGLDKFLNLNFKIQQNKVIEIMKSNLNLCNVIINWHTLDDQLFNAIIEFNNKKDSYQKIYNLNQMLNKFKITKLIQHNLIDINYENCFFLCRQNTELFIQLIKHKKNKNDFFQLIENNKFAIKEMKNDKLFSLRLRNYWFGENILSDLNKTKILCCYFKYNNNFYNLGLNKLKELISSIQSLKGFEKIFDNQILILDNDNECKKYLVKFLKEKNLISVSEDNRINLKPTEWKRWKK